jgi:uncharacterized protein YndB with AHSA1/START domain
MPNRFVEKSIQINTPVSKVWRVFTDPVLTRQMGGEYVSDWQVGSSLLWKGSDGQLQTNGSILKIEAEKLLRHNLFDLAVPETQSVLSVITYEFREQDGRTMLRAREDFSQPLDDVGYAAVLEGWDAALHSVKEIAEQG